MYAGGGGLGTDACCVAKGRPWTGEPRARAICMTSLVGLGIEGELAVVIAVGVATGLAFHVQSFQMSATNSTVYETTISAE